MIRFFKHVVIVTLSGLMASLGMAGSPERLSDPLQRLSGNLFTKESNKSISTQSNLKWELTSTRDKVSNKTDDEENSRIDSAINCRLPKRDMGCSDHVDFKAASKIIELEKERYSQKNFVSRNSGIYRSGGTLTSGVMFSKDVSLSDGLYSSNTLQITATSGEGKFSVKGIWGLSTPVMAEVDAETGSISIASQVIFHNSVYGDLYVCPISGSSYNPNGKIEGSLDNEGNVSWGSWGIFAISGSYAGYAVKTFSSSRWLIPNASAKTTGPREEDCMTFTGAVEQENTNTINIYGLLGYDNVVVGTLTPSHTISITPQKIYSAQVGAVMCYPVEETTVNGQSGLMIDYAGNVKGKETDNGFELLPWAAAVKGYGTAYLLESTAYTLSRPLRYPEPISAEWKGKGTIEEPYLISTPEELLLLGQKVEEGNSYAGYNFALTKDIDMSLADRAVGAIGSESNPFSGSFDGRNFSINNFKYNGYGTSAAGIFGFVSSSGVIKNLNIKNANITGSGANVAVLSGILQGKVENVHILKSSVSVSGEAGAGLCAQLEGVVRNSSFEGTVSGPGYVGGLIAFNGGVVENSHATATILLNGYYSTTYHNAGGLCAVVASTELGNGRGVVRDSYFSGEVRDLSGKGHIGGLACLASRATIERSFNVGVVEPYQSGDEEISTYAGGLCGYITASYIKDCYNAGTVIAQVTGSFPMKAIGGLFGYISVTRITNSTGQYFNSISRVENCYNSAMILTPNENSKQGVYGRTWDGSEEELEAAIFTNVYSDNQVFHGDTSSFGRTTRYLTASTLPAGFSSDVWTATSTQYPLLRSTATTDAALLSGASIITSTNQWIGKIKTGAQLNRRGSVTWGLMDNSGNISDHTANAEIMGAALKVGNDYSNEVLIAYTGDGGMKMYRLGLVPDGMYDGQGTSASPYLLKTVSDWSNLDRAVRVFGQGHEDDYFKMANDIDFAGSAFRGVGASNTVNSFDGILDGEGHSVHHLTINAANVDANNVLQSTGSYWHGGLFSLIGTKGLVKNLSIASDANIKVYHYGASVVGQLLGTVENCRNYAPIVGYGAYAGGIAGVVRDMGLVRSCYNGGVISLAPSIGQGVAGIAGYNIGTILNSQNDGEIVLDKSGKNSAAGIAAYNSGSVIGCVNTADISGPAYVGGIIGYNTSLNGAGIINKNINHGLASLSTDGITVGAIIGESNGIKEAVGNWYDASVNVDGGVAGAGHPGMKGVPTSILVSGSSLDGLENEMIDYQTGKYPVLMEFKTEPISLNRRSIYINFDDTQVRNNMKKSVSLVSPEGINWNIEPISNSYFTIKDNQLSVVIPSGMDMGKATIVASSGDKVYKSFDLKALPVYLTGEGTEEAPYLINNVDDFTKLATFVNTTGNDYKGVSFRLMNNLDFSGETLPMIAGAPTTRDNVVKFQGKFDGNGKAISNFKVEYDNHTTAIYSGGDRLAIFGTLGEAGEVKNLISAGSFSGLRYVAGIVGVLYGKIDNCVNQSSVNGTMSAGSGGLAGMACAGAIVSNSINKGVVRVESVYGGGGIVGETEEDVLIDKCTNEGDVIGSKAAKYIGGIVGRASGTIRNCLNSGKLVSEAIFSTSPMTFFGGIVGGAAGRALELKSCRNIADINLPNQTSVGGIYGGSTYARSETDYLRIDSCVNSGNVVALGIVGGVAGFVPSGTAIFDSSNEGNVKTVYNGSSYTSAGSAMQGTTQGYTGGFAGYVNSLETTGGTITQIVRCSNSGTVESGMAYVGGFAAYLSSGGIIESCYNEGPVISTSLKPAVGGAFSSYQVGGFIGNLSGKVLRSWNAGKVTANGHDIGGFVGLQSSKSEVNGCVNIGDVEVSSSAANSSISFHPIGGGLIGRANGSKTTNVINFGNVTSPDRAAGLVSMLFPGSPQTELMNGYNYAKVVNTASGASYISNIGNFRDENMPLISNIYYVKDQNPNIGQNRVDACSGVTAVDAESLRQMELGDEFIAGKAGLPMVKNLFNASQVHFCAAGISFSVENDNESNVNGNINITDLPDLIWSSSDGIEIVGSIALPRKTGTQWIKVSTADGKSERIFNLMVKTVNTAVMPTSISFDRTEIEAGIDDEITLNVTLTPDNITEVERTLVWTSSDLDVATVENGLVRCKTPGCVVITATTVNNISAQCLVTVSEILPINLTLSEHNHSGHVGEVFKLEVEFAPSNCTARNLHWSSDNNGVCMVDENGYVTMTGVGEAYVTATTVNGIEDTCMVSGLAGVEGVMIDGKEVERVEIYSLDGTRIYSTSNHEICVLKYIFTDGTVKVSKRIQTSRK